MIPALAVQLIWLFRAFFFFYLLCLIIVTYDLVTDIADFEQFLYYCLPLTIILRKRKRQIAFSLSTLLLSSSLFLLVVKGFFFSSFSILYLLEQFCS